MAEYFDDAARLRELNRYAILDTPADGAFDDVTALAARFFSVPIAIVSLVDRDRIWFKSAYGLGDVRQIGRGPGLCASAIMADTVYVASDLRTNPDALTNPLVASDNGFRFYAAAPLRSSLGHNLGTLCVIDLVPRAFSDDDEQMLARFGRVVMAQMEQRLAGREIADLAREVGLKNLMLSHSASHDTQTGLLNRGAIQARLDSLCAQDSEERQMATLLFDVDHFKAVNDRYGHLAGDAVLIEVARRIQMSLRPDDHVGRFGGEEFLVILVGCDRVAAARIAERVRDNVERTPVQYSGTDIRITISAGVYLVSGRTVAEAALRATDDALYTAKHEGRNRVVFSAPQAGETAADAISAGARAPVATGAAS